MSADRLAEIKARADAATEGPWVRDMHSPDMSGRSGWYIRGPRKLGLRSMVLNSRMLSGDAEFVEAAREDVPWLVDQVESLERWKFEATEVMSGLRELGKALGLGLGVQITGPAALAEVERLTAERDAAIERLERVIDQWRETGRAVISEMNRADKAEAERDALAGLLAEFVDSEPCSLDHHGYCQSHGHLDEGECHMARARAVLAGSDADASDTQPTDQETDEESAALVDRNLRAMGSEGLQSTHQESEHG